MAVPEPRSPANPRSHRPRVLDDYRTFKTERGPIGGGLPIWPFNRTRIVELQVRRAPRPAEAQER